MKYKWLVVCVCILAVGGCQAPPNIKQVQDKNRILQKKLDQANRRINSMQAKETLLNKDRVELNRVIGVLGTEKSSRVKESSSLRGQVRQFVQSQIDALKEFLVRGNLLDYVGGELVERTSVEEKPFLLVDFANPIPKNGALTGLGGQFIKPTTILVKVLRPVDKKWVVIWESKPLRVRDAGLNKINFPVSVGVEKGDLIAYFFPHKTTVGFDTGTGETLYSSNDVKFGETVSKKMLLGGKHRRTYSIGVYGLLN